MHKGYSSQNILILVTQLIIPLQPIFTFTFHLFSKYKRIYIQIAGRLPACSRSNQPHPTCLTGSVIPLTDREGHEATVRFFVSGEKSYLRWKAVLRRPKLPTSHELPLISTPPPLSRCCSWTFSRCCSRSKHGRSYSWRTPKSPWRLYGAHARTHAVMRTKLMETRMGVQIVDRFTVSLTGHLQ